MAITNGYTEDQISPTQHLGKRKRTPSPESEDVPKSEVAPVHQSLTDAFNLLRRNALSSMILNFPLSARKELGHTFKKRRIDAPDQENDNIESRMTNNDYESLDQLMDDMNNIKIALSEQQTKPNGAPDSAASVKEQINSILRDLTTIKSNDIKAERTSVSTTANIEADRNQEAPILPASQILSLKSQTEHGVKQLFSGLPKSVVKTDEDGRRLPNGFELTEVLTVGTNNLQGKDGRKFGDVFTTHRNTKTLEMPRASRPVKGSTLTFVAPFDNVANSNKNDFKFANLNTGPWLRYAINEKLDSEAREAKIGQKSSSLFKAAFSTFAPSTDNSHSVVTAFDKSQQWWKKYRTAAELQATFSTPIKRSSASRPSTTETIPDEDLEAMIANFIPDDDDSTESEKLLDEISELIETLNSYQSMRSLEVARGPSSASNPSKDEQGTFEMLRDQLHLLVSSLPPYAVAKLNGDQLDNLNISTKIVIQPPEFVGTAQADDYTMRRTRAAQASTSTAVRTTAPIQTRTTYGTPASAYNAQARAYNSIPNAAYTARPPGTAVYNTPRPLVNAQTPAYAQSPYRSAGPAIHTPSVQQFQRPSINGYGSVATPNLQSAYVQRPSQPNHQQRTQDGTVYNRADGLQKPTVNGETPYQQPRQHSISNINGSVSVVNTPGQHHAAIDVTKQRQESSTPQPQAGTEGVIA